MLKAYFDESEREGQLCVAGMAFAAPQARKLTREFQAAFGPYGDFHMTDLLAKRAGYKGITDAERLRLVKEAVRIVSDRYSYAVAVTVKIDEYMRQAPTFIHGMGEAYPFLCYNALVALKKMFDKHSDQGPVSYIFEAGHAYQGEARQFISSLLSVPELKAVFRHHSDAFLPKSDAVPLQAADLLAYEAIKFKHETVDKPIREMRLPLLRLYASRPNHIHFHFLDGEKLTTALNKFRQLGYEQLRENSEYKRQRMLQKSSKTAAQS